MLRPLSSRHSYSAASSGLSLAVVRVSLSTVNVPKSAISVSFPAQISPADQDMLVVHAENVKDHV